MSRFKQRPIAAAVVLMLSGTGPALAQQALPEVKVTAPPEGQGFKTDTTNINRTEMPLRDIPQFINTVPEPLIRQQAITSLQEALRNVPGVTFTAAEGGVSASQVFWLRGFPAGGDLFLDSVRDIGEYNRDLFNIERVEVLKGPAALTFGRGSTGGVINQVSKIADLRPRSEAALMLGTNGELRATADANFVLASTTALRLQVLGERTDTYRDTIQNDQIGIAPSLRFGIGTDLDIWLNYEYLQTKTKTDYGQPNLGPTFNYQMPPVPLTQYYGFAKYDFTNYYTNIATLNVNWRVNEAVSVRNVTRWASYKRDMEASIGTLNTTTLGGAAVTANTPFDQLAVTLTHNKARDNDDQVLINQTDVTWKVATGAIKHTVTGGMDLAMERLDRATYAFDGTPATAKIDAPQIVTQYLNPDINASLNYTKQPQNRNVSTADTIAAYVQDLIEFTPQWKLLLGVRYDHYDSKTNQTANGPAGTNSGPFERTDNLWSGRAGVIWQPTSQQSYWVSWNNGYNPSGELGVYGASATNLSIVNQNLDPEETYNYEVGGQWDLSPALRLRSSVFRTEKTNARYTDPADGLVKLEGTRRVDGVELELAGSITSQWDIYSGLAYMDGKILQSDPLTQGKHMTVAPWSGSVWTVYRFAEDLLGWQVGGGAFGSTSRWIDEQNRAKIPDYLIWSAMVGWFQPKYDIQFNVVNIFDTKYYVGGYQNNPNRVLPGQPLTGLLTMRYRFN